LGKEKFGGLKVGLLRRYAGILAISGILAEDYTGHGFDPERVFMLMNSVDTQLFAPAVTPEQKEKLRIRYGLDPHQKICLFVGTVNKRKGADILVSAFAAAAEANPEMHLVIVGASNRNENPTLDETFINEIMSLLDRKNLAGRVTFAGLVQDREKLADYYRLADIFVFPSRSEGLPTVVLEAMASGLAVIASALPALQMVIRSGENGIICPMEDPDSFACEMTRLVNDPILCSRLSASARNYIQENHVFEAWQTELSRVYTRLVTR
jgi:glycosyltransferase involved in cell wall biosynthesis